MIRYGTDTQLIGGGVAALGAGVAAGSQILGGGPEDPLSDIGSSVGVRISQAGYGGIALGTSAQEYGAGFLATNGMPRDAINTVAESYADKLDLVAPFAQPAVDQLTDQGLNALEDALGVENTCH